MINKNLPTKLFLNGPELSFETQTPTTIESNFAGIVTVTGVATAFFPTQSPENPGISDGSFTYDWYFDNTKVTNGGDISIATVGAASTITISGLDVTTDGKEIYAIVKYNATAYSQPTGSDVVAGTARSTGNAVNGELKSNVTTINSLRYIAISKQPEDSTAPAGFDHNFSIEADVLPAFVDIDLNYQWQIDGSDLTEGTSDQLIDGFFVSVTSTGTQTPNLTIVSNQNPITADIRCKLTAVGVSTSPLYSNTVLFNNATPQDILVFEAYDTTSTAITSEHTLYVDEDLTDASNQDVIISRSTRVDEPEISQQLDNQAEIRKDFSSDDICFYSKEKDLYIEVELYAASGIGNGNSVGGNGGFSRIRFIAERDQEYVIRGLKSNTALFLYRQASLIAVVGEGGAAGGSTRTNTARGGDGGGVNIGGLPGRFSAGSVPPLEGSLAEDGTWGARANPSEVYTGDTQETGVNPGTTIKCSKGKYWRDQGISPCSLNSSDKIKYRLADGTEVTNSASIYRGFKPGYAINTTGGDGSQFGTNTIKTGMGGNGATGGGGDQRNGEGGGGGGSGYSDGSIKIMESKAGENEADARVKIRLADPNNDVVLEQISFDVFRNASFSNTITFELQSGNGDNPIIFGPNAGSVSITVEKDVAIEYVLTSFTRGSIRLNNGRLQLEDFNDFDWNDLEVIPNQGRFRQESGKYYFNYP